MTTILAFDTSSEACSVCLSQRDVPSEITRIERVPRQHAQLLMPMIRSVLDEQKISLSDLDGLAFGSGPGSFTGLRIATGVAQGLSYGGDVPVLAVSNLQAMALHAQELWPQARYALVAFDARMNEVYWGLYDISGEDGTPPVLIGEERVSAPETVDLVLSAEQLDVLSDECLVGIGSGFEFFDRFSQSVRSTCLIHQAKHQPEARFVAQIAQQIPLDSEQWCLGAEVRPSYLRNEVTWKKLPGR